MLSGLVGTYFSVFRTICTMQRCCSVFRNAAVMASLMPVSPSEQGSEDILHTATRSERRMMPRLSFSPICMLRTSFCNFQRKAEDDAGGKLAGVYPVLPHGIMDYVDANHGMNFLQRPFCQSSICGSILSVTSR